MSLSKHSASTTRIEISFKMKSYICLLVLSVTLSCVGSFTIFPVAGRSFLVRGNVEVSSNGVEDTDSEIKSDVVITARSPSQSEITAATNESSTEPAIIFTNSGVITDERSSTESDSYSTPFDSSATTETSDVTQESSELTTIETEITTEPNDIIKELREFATVLSEFTSVQREIAKELDEITTTTSEVITEPSEVTIETSEVTTEPSEITTEPSEITTKTVEIKTESSEVTTEPTDIITEPAIKEVSDTATTSSPTTLQENSQITSENPATSKTIVSSTNPESYAEQIRKSWKISRISSVSSGILTKSAEVFTNPPQTIQIESSSTTSSPASSTTVSEATTKVTTTSTEQVDTETTTTESTLNPTDSLSEFNISINLLPPKTEYRKFDFDPRYDDWNNIPVEIEKLLIPE